MFFYKFTGIDDSYDGTEHQQDILWSYEQFTTSQLEVFVNQIIENLKPKLIAETQAKVDVWAQSAIIFPSNRRDQFAVGIFFWDFWPYISEALINDYGFRRVQFESEYSRKLQDLITKVGISKAGVV